MRRLTAKGTLLSIKRAPAVMRDYYRFGLWLMMPLLCSCGLFSADVEVTQMAKWTTDNADVVACRHFAMSKADVVTFFNTAKRVDKHKYRNAAVPFTCGYEGQLTIDKTPFAWRISAAGAGTIGNNNAAYLRFLCSKQCAEALPSFSQSSVVAD